MSAGPGRIQRRIIELTHKFPKGATLGRLCQEIYGSPVEKKHRVAVGRALKSITLPEGWTVGMMRLGKGNHQVAIWPGPRQKQKPLSYRAIAALPFMKCSASTVMRDCKP